MSHPERAKTRPPVYLSAGTTVSLNKTTVAMSCVAKQGGVECHLDCNGQRLTIYFDGTSIQTQVHEPAGP